MGAGGPARVAARPAVRRLRRFVPALGLLVAACGLWQCCAEACFSAVMTAARPPVVERPPAERAEKKRKESDARKGKDNIKVWNTTLLSSSGRPDIPFPGVTNGPPYATCFVEYKEAATRNFDGAPPPRTVLEKWVMRGEQQTVDSFRAWSQRGREPTNVRCMMTSSQAAEEATCLECVSSVPMMSPAGLIRGVAVGLMQTNNIMTFSGLHKCLANTLGAAGYCKSGLLSVPM